MLTNMMKIYLLPIFIVTNIQFNTSSCKQSERLSKVEKKCYSIVQ